MSLPTVVSITFGCRDPQALGEFYRQATAATIAYRGESSVHLATSGGLRLGFDRTEHPTPVPWPEVELHEGSSSL